MEKLRLNLDALDVESFAILSAACAPGTVAAHQDQGGPPPAPGATEGAACKARDAADDAAGAGTAIG